MGSTAGRSTDRTRRHLLANGVVLGWLVAAVVVGLGYDVVPDARWLLVHLFGLGAVTTAILVWSTHFTVTLLHRPQPSPAAEGSRLVLLTVGAAAVCWGAVEGVWSAVAAGAAAVVVTVVSQLGFFVRSLARSGAARFSVTVRYYVGAFLLLGVGMAAGAAMEHGTVSGEAFGRFASAHLLLNLLGFVGLTVVGTLVMMWPMLLRTRIADNAEADTGRALPVLVVSLLVAAAGAAAGSGVLAALGLLGYAAGLALPARSWLDPARRKPPRAFPARSVALGGGWLVGTTVALAVQLLLSGETGLYAMAWVTPALLLGFAAQVLVGGLSFLGPVVIGGGPAHVRRTIAVSERLPLVRLVAVNLGVLLVVWPLSGAATTAGWLLALLGLGVTVPLLVAAALQRREEQGDLAGG